MVNDRYKTFQYKGKTAYPPPPPKKTKKEKTIAYDYVVFNTDLDDAQSTVATTEQSATTTEAQYTRTRPTTLLTTPDETSPTSIGYSEYSI